MKSLDTALHATPFTEALGSGRQAPGGFSARLTAGLERVLLWQERIVERRRLQTMSDHELRDIGVSRADIEVEARKPFWRA